MRICPAISLSPFKNINMWWWWLLVCIICSHKKFSVLSTEFVGHTMDDVSIADETRTNEAVENKLPEVEVSFDDLMARIRHIVLTSRLRVSNICCTELESVFPMLQSIAPSCLCCQSLSHCLSCFVFWWIWGRLKLLCVNVISMYVIACILFFFFFHSMSLSLIGIATVNYP